jgi:hypothetical protein
MDDELEALIDKAGRDRVFARAQTYGWSASSSPPKWVWRQIAEEVLAGTPPAVPPPPQTPMIRTRG